MSHVTKHRAVVTHHAVVRYATRILGATVPEGMKDREALLHVTAQGGDCAWVRSRLAKVGGIVIASGHATGTVIVAEEGMKVRVDDGRVVTILTPDLRGRPLPYIGRPSHALLAREAA